MTDPVQVGEGMIPFHPNDKDRDRVIREMVDERVSKILDERITIAFNAKVQQLEAEVTKARAASKQAEEIVASMKKVVEALTMDGLLDEVVEGLVSRINNVEQQIALIHTRDPLPGSTPDDQGKLWALTELGKILYGISQGLKKANDNLAMRGLYSGSSSKLDEALSKTAISEALMEEFRQNFANYNQLFERIALMLNPNCNRF